MDDKKWMNDIRRKMDGFEMSPPEHLWDDIERQMKADLAEHKTVRLHAHRTWMAAAIMTGVLVMGGGVWLSTHQESGSVSPSFSSNDNANHGSIGLKTPLEHDYNDAMGNSEDNMLAEVKYKNNLSQQSETQQSESQQSGPQQTEPQQPQPSQQLQPRQSQPHHDQSRKPRAVTPASSWDNTLLASRHSDENRFSVSVAAAGLMGSNNMQGGYGELLAGSIWQGGSDEGVKGDDSPSGDFGSLEEVIVGNNNKEVYTQKKHSQPVKLGVSVSYRLSGSWSISAGVTHSYLSSELTSGTDDSHYATYQKLQYVGIPVNVSYTFYQHKRWSVYGTTGGMVEKCVKGKSTTDYVVGGKKVSSQNDDVKEKRLQYSVGAAVGVQAKIVDHVGFYLEPGVSYHFDNHSDVTNIYKDTPLNFSLGLGFRYSF